MRSLEAPRSLRSLHRAAGTDRYPHGLLSLLPSPNFFFPAHIPRGEHTLSDGRCDGVLSFFSLSPSMNVSNGNDRDYEGRDITPASLRVGGPQPFPLWPSVNVRALLPIGLCISNIRGMFSQYVCHSSKKEFRLCVYDVQIVLDISIDLSVLNYF